jgi:hypothetical protein
MRNGFTGAIVAAVGTAVVVFSLTAQPSGQAAQGAQGRGQGAARPPAPQGPARPAAAAPAAGARLARIAGHPNINGIYQSMTSAYWNLEDHPAQATQFWQLGAIGAIPAGQSIVEGGTIPYKADALKQRDANRKDWPKSDPEAKCYMPGIPRATYMPYPFQIVQGQKDILFVYEYASSNRIVHMSNPTEPAVDSWMGWSNGKWEGETLVVDTTGYLDSTWFDRAGNHHSDALHTIERISARSAETLNYEITIEDPNTFTRTWKMSFPLYKHVEPNAQLTEYRCVEFSEEVIYGHMKKKASE